MLPNSALGFEGLLSWLSGNVPWFCVSALRLPALLLDFSPKRLYWDGTHHFYRLLGTLNKSFGLLLGDSFYLESKHSLGLVARFLEVLGFLSRDA